MAGDAKFAKRNERNEVAWAHTGNIFGQEFARKSGSFGPIADWDGGTATGNVWRGNRFADGRPVEPERKAGP